MAFRPRTSDLRPEEVKEFKGFGEILYLLLRNVTDISHVCHVWIKMVTRHSSKHTHSGNSDSINIIYVRAVAVYQRRRRKKTLQSLHPRPRLCVSA